VLYYLTKQKEKTMKPSPSSKLFGLFILIGLLWGSTFAQLTVGLIQEGKALSAKAYIAYDKNIFTQAHEIFEKLYSADSTNNAALYNLTYAEYRFLEMGSRDKALYEKYVNQAVAHGEKISSVTGFASEGKTLLASILMMKITHNWAEAMTLSPRIYQLLGEAKAIDPENPRAYLIYGIMKFNTPAAFGGSTKEALENFTKAISLFEKNEQDTSLLVNWGHLDALAWMGIANEKLEMLDAAEFVYKKALSIEPEFAWVKHVLLPNLEKAKDKSKTSY